MSDSLFRVVFISDLVEPESRDVVKRNLATLFGTTPGNLDRLFDPSPIILKKNLNREEAVRFRDAIVRCGAFCRIETMDSVAEVMVSLAEDRPGEDMVCPRCFKSQTKSALCRHCGAIVQEYVPPPPAQVDEEDDINRRYYDRRQDLETSINVADDQERRSGRDRRRAHLDWRM